MTNASVTSLDPVLKKIYEKRAQIIAYENHPFLAMVPKTEDFGGKNYVFAVRYAANGGRSATFATAQGQKVPNAYKEFTVTRKSDYQLFEIDGEAIEAAAGDANTMADGLQSEIDGATETISASLATALYRSGSGSLGVVGSISGTALTLAEPLDIVNFDIGMTLSSDTVDGTGTVDAGTALVTGIDRNAGILYTGSNWTAQLTAPVAAGHYLFGAGDYAGKMPGIAGWLPATAPTFGGSDSFYGVNRGVDPVRLAGLRYNGSGAPKEETLMKVLSMGFTHGAKFSHLFLNPDDGFEISVAMASKIERMNTTLKDVQDIGFAGFRVLGPAGPVDVYPDPDCPKGLFYPLTLNTWELKTLGKAPRFLNADGNKILRTASADSYEGRMGYRGALICRKPGKNLAGTW